MKAAKLANLKSKLNKKSKVKTHDVSADSPPWDEEPKKKKTKRRAFEKSEDIIKEARHLGIRSVGASEDDEDDMFEEENTQFEKQMRGVAKRINDKRLPYNAPATQELVTREALASVIRQLPGYERAMQASSAERAAYAYSNLINQVRELMSDLRAMSSTDALADRVITEAVEPLFMNFVQFTITEISLIRNKLNGASSLETIKRSVNQQLSNTLVTIGQHGDESMQAAVDKARDSLRS